MSENELNGLEEVGGNKEELTRKYLLHRFWRTGRDFWIVGDRRFAWGLSAVLLCVIVLNIAASYGMKSLEPRDF